MTKTASPLRIGVLGAAAINYPAIIDPSQTHPDTIIAGIAARSKARAEAQIVKYGIKGCRAYASYDEILTDPTINAIYIPLPNGLHCEWAVKAMEAGKHVLIEKPVASNAEEARRIKETSEGTGKVALEAYHPLFHPAAHRVKALIESGDYGNVIGIDVRFLLPRGALAQDDIRFKYELAGGASMDLAYGYCACLYFRGAKDATDWDVRILEARPRLHAVDKKIDEAMVSRFVMDTPGRKSVQCNVHVDSALPHLWGFIPRLWDAAPLVVIDLERAKIEFPQFPGPQYGHSIVVREKDASGKLTDKKTVEKSYVGGEQWGTGVGEEWWTTYRYQLEAFVGMIRASERGEQWNGPCMSMTESVKLMQMVDALYDKAGLPRRGT